MKIHEFQAKQVLSHFGIPVPKGEKADSAEAAGAVIGKLFSEGATAVVVKAQIHAGGRGKAGGVKVCKDQAAAEAAAREILGKTLVTPQTGPAGKEVKKLLIEEGQGISRELYASMILDRSAARPAIVVCPAGGMEIEEVAKHSPEKIFTERVDPILGLRDFQIRRLCRGLELKGEAEKQAVNFFFNLFQAFMEMDCRLLEVNPLVVTEDGRLLALDAKMDFDDTALFRHPDAAALRDPDEEDPLEVEAAKYKLNYIKLDGNVGCMVNGAGLAMATMDLTQTVGLMPANFLDVGGGANQEMIENAFRLLLGDPKVKGVLINIFGGILRCDVLARGIVEAGKKLGPKVPMVARLQGTNDEEGRKILAESGLNFTVAVTFQEAADKLREVMKGVR